MQKDDVVNTLRRLFFSKEGVVVSREIAINLTEAASLFLKFGGKVEYALDVELYDSSENAQWFEMPTSPLALLLLGKLDHKVSIRASRKQLEEDESTLLDYSKGR